MGQFAIGLCKGGGGPITFTGIRHGPLQLLLLLLLLELLVLELLTVPELLFPLLGEVLLGMLRPL